MAYDAHLDPFSRIHAAGHPVIEQCGNDVTHLPLTAATARAVFVDLCSLTANKSVTSVIICDPRVTVQRNLSQLLRPLRSLTDIVCVPDGFALMDAYSARGADIVLIGIERFSDTGPEAVALQSAMHPESVIITVGAAVDADLLVAATIAGAQGLLVWDHNRIHARRQSAAGWPHTW